MIGFYFGALIGAAAAVIVMACIQVGGDGDDPDRKG